MKVHSKINNFISFKSAKPIKKQKKNNKRSVQKINSQFKKNSFKGLMTKVQESFAKKIVHGFAVSASTSSAIIGEAAATGADFLSTSNIQIFMMHTLQKYLQVPPAPSLIYTTREIASGTILAGEGSKVLTSLAAGAAHSVSIITGTSGASAGASHALISKANRGINGGISFALTEKLGRGYINRVKQNKMSFKDQAIEAAFFFARRGIDTDTISDLNKSTSIKAALDAVPDDFKDYNTKLIRIASNLNLERIPNVMTINLGQNILTNVMFTKGKAPKEMKEIIKDTFKQSFISSCVYDICDIGVESLITKQAADTINDMTNDLDKYPEALNSYKEIEKEFIKKANLDKIDTHEFVEQFKNEDFILELSKLGRGWIKEFSNAWVYRKSKKQDEQKSKLLKELKKVNEESLTIQKNKISAEEEAIIKAKLEEFKNELAPVKNVLTARENFGYSKIAGYEDIKDLLIEKFIIPVGFEKSGYNNVPNCFLFYGTTGNGKTTSARALSEQAKCQFIKVKTFMDKQKIIENLKNIALEAQKDFKDTKKRTIILIDEFDDIAGKNSPILEELGKFLDTCSKDYHCTLITTTNKPLDIDKSILTQSIKIPFSPPNKKNAIAVLKHYLECQEGQSLNYEKPANEITKNMTEDVYSNSQIEAICQMATNRAKQKDRKIIEDDILKSIQKIKPEIKKDTLKDFKVQKDQLSK